MTHSSPSRGARRRRRRAHARHRGAPAHAQWIVFDPTNFAQNVLTAARELQQINNEIQSLENQATIADQPGAQSGEPALFVAGAARAVDPAQTQQLLDPGAAHRLQRHHDRSGVHADLSAGLFELDLHRSSSSPTRRPAGRTRSPASRTPCACRPAWCRISTARAPRSTRWSRRASPPPARFRRPSPATSSWRCRPSSSPISPP